MKKIVLLLSLTLSLFGGISEGDSAADFSLKTLDTTKTYTMKSFKGKVVLLNLWASWCSGCKAEMPEFYAFEKKYHDKLSIVTVSIDANSEDAQSFLGEISKQVGYKTPFITLHNPDKSLAKAYRAMGMPSSYLIDKKGVVRKVIVGSIDAKGLEALLDDINSLQ